MKAVLNLVLLIVSVIELGFKLLADWQLRRDGERKAENRQLKKTVDLATKAREIEATNNDPDAARDWLRDRAAERAKGFGRSGMPDDGPP